MARPKSPSIEPIAPALKPGALAHVSQNINELAQLDSEAEVRTLELARKLGYDGPLDPDVIERGVVNQMRRTVEACLETGRMLLVLKERVGHGNFMARLERLGIAYQGAGKFMRAAVKFSNYATSNYLTDAIRSPSALIELLVLDQEEVDELASEGSVLGITADEFSGLSISEMRAKLREGKQTLEARNKIIAKRDSELAAIEEEAEARRLAPLPEQEAAQLDELRDVSLAAQDAIQRLLITVNNVMNAPSTESAELAARQSIDYVVQRLADVCGECGVAVDVLGERVEPGWMRPITEAVEQAKKLRRS